MIAEQDNLCSQRGGADSNIADDVLGMPTSCEPIQPRFPKELEGRWHSGPSSRVVKDLHDSDPDTAQRMAQAAAAMPDVGGDFLGFRLLAELGRGAFARVYLARQGDLAGRVVVLKITPTVDDEPQTLAQLQHTNVVPIYSLHRQGSLQALCMPYFGTTTLAGVLKDLKTRKDLPGSGRDLIDTLMNCRSTLRSVRATDVPSGTETAARLPEVEATVPQNPPPCSGITSTVILDVLKKFTYTNAILWIGSRLADGLAHAHERGILHRDLKPANILLTDEGQPMLLDFNLAHDTKQDSLSSALVGGTLPYMSPEQLRAFQLKDSGFLNFTSDIYSLGIILYELLTGRHPFEIPDGSVKEILEQMIRNRTQRPPRLRVWNKAISPAVEAIVRRCLEPDPAHRYQSARELKEDLDCQLKNLPLRHATEPSPCERARKWMRRHPRLASSSSVAGVAAVLLCVLLGVMAMRSQRLAELEAVQSFDVFLEDKKAVQFLLTGRTPEREDVKEGMIRAKHALAKYHVLDDDRWDERSQVTRLPQSDQRNLRENVGDLLMLLARSMVQDAEDFSDASQKIERYRHALALNERAERTLAGGAYSRALSTQRVELLGLLGRNDDADALKAKHRDLPLQSGRDYYLAAAEQTLKGNYLRAIPLLQQATRHDPQHFWAWCLLAICHDGLSQDADAVACYSTCIALWPRFHWTHFNRGLAYLRQKDYKRAAYDFDEVLKLKPQLLDAYLNRALARQGLGELKQAEEDLTTVLQLGGPHTRALFLRARLRDKLGDREGAKQDYAEGLRQEPGDEKSWVARALARLSTDVAGALADLDRALELNPRSLIGLQNKAHVLSKQGRNEAALEVLNKAVILYPDFVPARAGRAVILARLNKREQAHKDAEECLMRDSKPGTVYQLAGVYALTSVQNAEDRREAYRLLSSALRRGFGFEYLESDRELESIRHEPEFQRIVTVARAFHATTALHPPGR